MADDMTADFKALDIGYEVQKSFANKFFSNKNVAKGLIDSTSAALLDEVYKLIKIYTKSKKEAEKVVKNLIKISVKLGMLERSDKFSASEKSSLLSVQRNLRTVAMTLISFHQVEHTYDRNFLIKYLTELRDDLRGLAKPHLTDKSVGRIDHIMDFFSAAEFLDSLYIPGKDRESARQMGVLMELLNRCMEEGVL